MNTRYIVAIIVLSMGMSGPALAQGDDSVHEDEVAEGRAMVQAARDDIVSTTRSLRPSGLSTRSIRPHEPTS